MPAVSLPALDIKETTVSKADVTFVFVKLPVLWE